jgi:SSS family solute:Na+ symporter
MLRVKSALDAWWNLQGIFTGGMLGLFLLGLISRKARNPQAILSVVVGTLLILWLSLSKTDLWPESWSVWANPLHSFMTIILGTSSIVLLGALIGHFANGRKENSKLQDSDPK